MASLTEVGAVVDRLEGNTQGKAAVFGMLHTAGLKLRAAPGDAVFSFIQRIGHILSGGQGLDQIYMDGQLVEIPRKFHAGSKFHCSVSTHKCY